jgi:Cd2+/Zn2+-exporting ATPase
MDCASCSERIEKSLCRIQGVNNVNVNLMAATVEIETDDGNVSPKAIIEKIKEAGFDSSQIISGKMTVILVEEMDCPDESSVIEKKLLSLNGVSRIQFNLIEKTLKVEHSCPVDDVLKAIKSLGFDAKETMSAVDDESRKKKSFLKKHRHAILAGASGILIVAAYTHSLIHEKTDILTYILYISAMVTGGWNTARKGLIAVRNLSLDMNFLMTIAVVGAAAIGEWHEGAMVVFLFSVANLLENYSMDRARRAVRALMQISPNRATILRGDELAVVDVESIGVGEVILIRPGEKIPMDGEVIKGNTHVNQAPITGESVPVKKEPGDEVYAGTLNERGAVEIRVTKLSKDNTLSRIIHMIEEAQAQKAPSQRFIDRFAKYYTPLVIAASLIVLCVPTVIFGQPFIPWLYKSLVLLIIACPCALVISTPVAIVTALSKAAKSGVLIKGGAYLEAMGSLNAVALDKTGTLTQGIPRVVDIILIDGKNEKEILRVAASLESRSEHHLGKAIMEKSQKLNVSYPVAESFQAITGKGATAIVDGQKFYIGNHRLFEEMGFCKEMFDEELLKIEGTGQTVVMVGNEHTTLGVIVIADDIRETSKMALKRIKDAGIKKTVMLTGDNLWTAEAIAKKIDIDEVKAGLLPEDKVEAVRELIEKHGAIAMVGDGVNDAPALAAATVGIAMGATGTDAALETADVVLMADDLRKLPYAIKLSRKTLSVIRQNIILALGIKAVFLVAAVGGVATLWMAVFADMGASMIVIFNGLRLMKMANGEKTQ